MLLTVLVVCLHAVADDGAVVNLVATGATGGIGSGTWSLSLPPELQAASAVRSVRAFHGAMTWQRAVLVAEDHRVETLVTLRSTPPACEPLPPVRRWAAPQGHVLVDPQRAPTLGAALDDDTEVLSHYRCAAGDAAARLMLGPGQAMPTSWTGFEYRLALQLEVEAGDAIEPATVIGVPLDDPARRVAALVAARDRHPEVLFVDAGDFVDAESAVRDGDLSLHRPTGFSALHRLQPTALAPGRNELVRGIGPLLAEAEGLPYVLTNALSADGTPPLPAARERTIDGRRVVFLATIDPDLDVAPILAAEGVVLTDPVEALRTAVSDAGAADLVVVLSTDPRVLEVAGVDVVVGLPGPGIDRVSWVEVGLRPPWSGQGAAPLVVPLDGVIELTVGFGPQGADRAVWTPLRVNPDRAPDVEVLHSINGVRDAVYPAVDRPLIGASPDGPLSVLDRDTWHTVACEAMRQATGADVGLLPLLPEGEAIPGPQTELLVSERLAVLDWVEVHEVGGDLLPRLLDKALAAVPVACGARLGEKNPKVGGRAIDPLRTYRVATTDRLMRDGAVQGLVAEARSSRLLDQPVVHAGPTLRTAVLQVLRDMPEAEVLPTLTGRSPDDIVPQWLATVARGAVSVSRFRGVDDDTYASIPETNATSPSSLTLAGDVDLALAYSSRTFAWDVRTRALYTRLDTDAESTEPADDLRPSTSASFPAAVVRLGAPLTPYSELLLDSEITPTVAEDGTANPRQADLSLSAGVSTSGGPLTRVRLGALLLRDLSVSHKGFEPGARLETATRVGLGPGLSWTTAIDGFLFADSRGQDVSDLRFKALVDTRLELPLARWLSIAPYGQAFVFAGRVAETRDPALSWTLGTALDAAGAWSLATR